MLETMKLLMANPLQAVVTVLAAGTISIGTSLYNVRTEVAVLNNEQVHTTATAVKVDQMGEVLIRVDENVKIIKERLDAIN